MVAMGDRTTHRAAVRVREAGALGPADGRPLLLVHTGGTIGMTGRAGDGALVPLSVHELADRLPGLAPTLEVLGLRLTVVAADPPVDSATIGAPHWAAIAEVIDRGLRDHVGAIVLHGTDTMAFTASALSFLLADLDRPVVLTGAQRALEEAGTDGPRNLTDALVVASDPGQAAPRLREVVITFDGSVLRGNRSIKVHADHVHAFDTPNHPPLGYVTAGGDGTGHDGVGAVEGCRLELTTDAIGPVSGRAPGPGPIGTSVAALRLHPAVDEHVLETVALAPGRRGLLLDAYGAGNGPSDPWYHRILTEAVRRGTTVLMTTQCRAGAISPGRYASGAALVDTGVVSGGDLTFEAALTKLMVLTARHEPDDVARLVATELVGEMTTDHPTEATT